jgi:phosphatidylglycerophosphatase A
MGGWEIILAVALVSILFFIQWLMGSLPGSKNNSDSGFLLWIARGFGVGRIPIAPGTFGSIVGIVWFAMVLVSGRWWTFILGTLVGLALSVWICGVAERKLQQKDPSSVVLDEITAMPVCFVALMGFAACNGSLPGFGYFLAGHRWLWLVGVFAAFRVFDVLKPWPVRQSQSLPGGWGITIDDVLAAVYVNLVVVLIEAGKAMIAVTAA